MYKIDGARLRVCKAICSELKKKGTLKNYRLILFQHFFEDTFEFVEYLKDCIEIEFLMGKEYSINQDVVRRFENKGFDVRSVPYKFLDKGKHLSWLLDVLKKCKETNSKLIISEVGGYFSSLLEKIPKKLKPYLAGIIEDTTFGYTKYKNLKKLEFPVFQVARSKLKEIEAMFVGRAIVLVLNRILRKSGLSLPGRRALVIGYGMINSFVAEALASNHLSLSCYDINYRKNLSAYFSGIHVGDRSKLIKEADIIICSTGTNSIYSKDFELMKDGIILASAGSRDIEIDIHSLKNLSEKVERVSKYIEKFTFKNGKTIFLLNKGIAINFIEESIPTEVKDLVYAETIECLIELATNDYKPSLHALEDDKLSKIAKRWLEENSSLKIL